MIKKYGEVIIKENGIVIKNFSFDKTGSIKEAIKWAIEKLTKEGLDENRIL